MTEPTATLTSGVALGAGVITITGSFLGLDFDVLLLGLFGGLFSLQHVAPLTRWQLGASLASASFLGAALSPFAGAFVRQYATWAASGVPPESPRLASAVLIGMAAQFIIPIIVNRLKVKSQTL